MLWYRNEGSMIYVYGALLSKWVFMHKNSSRHHSLLVSRVGIRQYAHLIEQKQKPNRVK